MQAYKYRCATIVCAGVLVQEVVVQNHIGSGYTGLDSLRV